MKIEKGVLSSSQLMFLVAGFIQGSVLLVAFTNTITKQYTWQVVLSGLAVSFPVVLTNMMLAKRFPDKNLIQITDIIYGRYLGKLISFLYIWFFFAVASFMLGFVGDIFKNYIMPETPKLVFCVMFALVCAWVVRYGIEVLARTSVLFVMIAIIEILITYVLLLKDMKITNFLPFFELPLKSFIQGTNIMVAIPYLEIMVFLMVTPYVNKAKEVKKSVILGLLIGAACLLLVTVRNTAVLGITSTIMTSPSIEAVRLIDIGDIITRLEMLVMITLLVTLYMKISVLYYATALAIAQLFKLRSYKPLVFPIGCMIISFAMLAYDSMMENADVGAKIAPVYTLAFEFLPLLSLAIAIIRKLPQKQKGGGR